MWLWLNDAPHRLSKNAARAIGRASAIGISAVTVFEVAELVEHEKIRLALPLRQWLREALSTTHVLAVTADVAVDAAQLRFARDPFDRLIYATARSEDAQLITRDARMHDFDSERAVW